MARQNRQLTRIDCSPLVTHEDLNRYVDHCKHGCDTDRRLMQEARILATNTWERWRKDCEIFCYGDHLSLSFSSGDGTNTFVVQVLDDNIIIGKDHESWPKWGVSSLSFVANGVTRFVCWTVDKSIDVLKAVGSISGLGSIVKVLEGFIGQLAALT